MSHFVELLSFNLKKIKIKLTMHIIIKTEWNLLAFHFQFITRFITQVGHDPFRPNVDLSLFAHPLYPSKTISGPPAHRNSTNLLSSENNESTMIYPPCQNVDGLLINRYNIHSGSRI